MASANVTESNDATFEQDVLRSEVPVLVDFWGNHCPPCKAIAPHVDALADTNAGKLRVVKLDTGRNPKAAMQFGVVSLPTFLVFKGGRVVGKQVGVSGGAHGLKKLVEPHLG
jgi:thioredoxin 1